MPPILLSLILNSLPNDRILDWSKLKAFTDNKIKVLKMMIFVFDKVENIVGKGENAGYQRAFYPRLLYTMFSEGFLPRVINPFPHNDTF